MNFLNRYPDKATHIKDYVLCDPKVWVFIIRMRAVVDDSVHVQVKVVELWDLVLLDHLTQAGVPLRQPAIEFWDPHGQLLTVLRLVCNAARIGFFVF